MTRLMTFALPLALTVGAIGMLDAAPRTAQDPVTLTGCLRAGSGDAVFILRGAAAPVAAGQIARDYLLVAIPDGVDLAPLVNHRVAVTGTVHTPDAAPPPPDGANSAERALRRIAVRGVTDAASNCD